MIDKSNGKRIKYRNFNVETYSIPNMSPTLTRAFIGNATIYFSCDNPIAIKYVSGKPIMTFGSFGEITTRNKLRLRETIDYVTITESKFCTAIFDLLSRN